MLIAGELKGELARIYPARECCRLAELVGLTYGDTADALAPPGRLHGVTPDDAVELRTLDPATARVAVHLAGDLGALRGDRPRRANPPVTPGGRPPRDRRRLRVVLDRGAMASWSWEDAPACDRRSFIRGLLLASGSVSFSSHGAHVEFVFRDARRADEARQRLGAFDVRASIQLRRGRRVLYVKGGEEVATLLRLAGANRGLLDFENERVGREVRNGLNRLLNAEAANLSRTVAAAGRQLESIDRLERAGVLPELPAALREVATLRRRHPDADLDSLAAHLGVSRSAANHRLRRLVELADDLADDLADPRDAEDAKSARRR